MMSCSSSISPVVNSASVDVITVSYTGFRTSELKTSILYFDAYCDIRNDWNLSFVLGILAFQTRARCYSWGWEDRIERNIWLVTYLEHRVVSEVTEC
jgi:hypothetical protein